MAAQALEGLKNMTIHYDYFVIGAGSGGVRSARIAASHGAKVGIAEGKHYGGTCVNVGCVPKKIYSYASEYSSHVKDAANFGWSVDGMAFDWATLRENKKAEISRLEGIYGNLLKNAGVTTYSDYARFIDEKTVEVGGEKITADRFLIAVGGTPNVPDCEGKEHILTSDEIFDIETFPKHITIVGGGYIAVEFAGIFKGLGAEVTQLYRSELFMRGFDDDIREHLAGEMRESGVDLRFNTDLVSVEKNDSGFKVKTTTGDEIETDLVFAAIGRSPLTEGLGLDKAGVDIDRKGAVVVNDDFQTSKDHIYAVGDVIDRVALTPVALAEGHVLSDRLYTGADPKERFVDYTYIASAVFSHPPISTVGKTEQEALAEGLEIVVFQSGFRPLKHTISKRETRSLMKLIVNKADQKVIGAHMIGEDSPEIMQAIAIAMNMGATKADFDRTIGIHPTAAEEFVTMRTPRG